MVVEVDLAGPTTLEDQRSQLLRGFPGGTDFRGVARTEIGGSVPGYRIRAEWSSAGNPIRGDFLLAVKGTRVFSVGAVAAGDAFDQFEADFGRIIDSFEITLEPPTEAISTTAKSQDVMEAIGHRVALIRSLPALPETNGRFLAREDFNARVEVLDEEMRRDAVRLKGLCLILDLCSPEHDLLEVQLGLLDKGVLGFYKTQDKSLTLVAGRDGPNLVSWLTYAHEYSHAIQDRAFGLDSISGSDRKTSDSSRAALALVEGDSKIAEYLFYDSLPLDQQTKVTELLEEEIKEFAGSIDVAALPRITIETFGWEQTAGTEFAFQLYLEGGFKAIDQAFKSPPSSTEQVLHPEKYLAGDEPHSVALPYLASALGSPWELQDEGVLGELLTRIYLGTFLMAGRAGAAAAGWGGDWYRILKDDQERQLLAAAFSWDSAADADQFFQAYLDFVEGKSKGQWELAESSESSRLWVGQGTSTYLAIDGDTTRLVIGPDLGTVEAAAGIISVPTNGG